MNQYGMMTRIQVRLLCVLFKLLCPRRWHLSLKHIKRSSLNINSQEAKEIARCALENLALTATRALTRALGKHGDFILEVHGHGLSERLTSLKSQGVNIKGHTHLQSVLNSSRGVMILSAHI